MSKIDQLHNRNKHRGMYDFESLIASYPELGRYVTQNKYGNLSVDFSDPRVVKALNKALLIHFYGIESWDIPNGSLCPPIPGRADYIHHIADIVEERGEGVRCLDIGVGANCIYPIVGSVEYGWSFVGSDINSLSLENAQKIVDSNDCIRDRVELRLQPNRESIFAGLIRADDRFDITICNPPFHDSAQSAERGSLRKLRNLRGQKPKGVTLNFGGNSNELWCEGGEIEFLTKMIRESRDYAKQCKWFTTLVSKEDNLNRLRHELDRQGVADHKVIEMTHGNKTTRILVWRF